MLENDQAIDAYRLLVFPNRIRERRRAAAIGTLMGLADRLQQIPYIRLSKIERGEIYARPDELADIAAALNVAPIDLLHDVAASSFDIATWAAENSGSTPLDPDVDRQSVLLAAALRVRRESDPGLTIGAIERRYGIAPVILSRIEHAVKAWPRWNAATMTALCSIFDVADVAALHASIDRMDRSGRLADAVAAIAHPRVRMAKSAAGIAELRRQLIDASSPAPARAVRRSAPRTQTTAQAAAPDRQPLVVPVFGTPLPNGLVARTALANQKVEAPSNAGPSSYGLRVCRPTLGLGMPPGAIVVVDPDRFPAPGGLAVVEESAGVRLVAVSVDREGRLLGYASNPEHEVRIDDLDPSRVAAVIAAVL